MLTPARAAGFVQIYRRLFANHYLVLNTQHTRRLVGNLLGCHALLFVVYIARQKYLSFVGLYVDVRKTSCTDSFFDAIIDGVVR